MSRTFDVLLDFGSAAVILAPLSVAFKSVLICCAGNIAPDPWVSEVKAYVSMARADYPFGLRVLPPSPSNLFIFFINREVKIGNSLGQSNASQDTGESSTDTDYFHWTRVVDTMTVKLWKVFQVRVNECGTHPSLVVLRLVHIQLIRFHGDGVIKAMSVDMFLYFEGYFLWSHQALIPTLSMEIVHSEIHA